MDAAGAASLSELAWFHFTIGRIGDFNGTPVLVSRTGYTGELGYEIFCHPKHALAVWDAVWEAGKAHGMAPLGLEALDMLRIEAGLIFFNYEFSDQTDPFEAGIGFTVALKSNEDFVGRDALLRRKQIRKRRWWGWTSMPTTRWGMAIASMSAGRRWASSPARPGVLS